MYGFVQDQSNGNVLDKMLRYLHAIGSDQLCSIRFIFSPLPE